MAKFICMLILSIIIVISADGHLVRKHRSKRAVPAASFFKGVFTWIMRAVKFGMGVSFMETGDNQISLPRDVVGSVIAKLENIQSAIDSLEQNILQELRQVKALIKLNFAFSHHAVSIERLDELVEDFIYAIKDHNNTGIRLNKWAVDMLATDARGAKSVLYNIHKLVTGQKHLGRLPIFQLFFETAVTNGSQSRLWQTEVYADSLLSHQALLYGLWITALQISNPNTLSSDLTSVNGFWNNRSKEQFSTLVNVRRDPSAYHVPSTVEVKEKIFQLCSTTPTCIAKGYKLETLGGSAQLRPDCVSEQLQEWISPVCMSTGMVESRFNSHRRFSTAMLTVPDRETQAICGVSISEEKVGPIVYIRMSATICLKNSTNLIFAALPELRSTNAQIQKVSWPYRLATSNYPKEFGWVTGVGLQLASDDSIQIKEQTDYFPSILPD